MTGAGISGGTDGFTRKSLQQFAVARDAHLAAVFRHSFRVRGYHDHQILAVDETSKDMRALRRSFGYSLRGRPAIGTSGLLPRGTRTSALCSFDVDGFVAWSFCSGTYNREGFLEAAEHVILDQVTPFPGPRSIVLLDNASIHRSARFVEAVNACGAIVLFTPPYCWDLTPLDNGAFGWVKNWLTNEKDYIASQGWTIEQALTAAFRALGPEAARSFFRRCNMRGQ